MINRKLSLYFSGTLSLLLASIYITSCNNPQRTIEPDSKKTVDSIACYQYFGNKDTVILRTADVNGAVTGVLEYAYDQKDKNSGTIQGKMFGDTLIADYRFKSEGTVSERQVAFLKTNEGFIEGYTESIELNGKFSFKHLDSLKFSSTLILKKTDCPK